MISFVRTRPTVWPSNKPQIGQSYTLAIDGMNPAVNVAILLFGFTQFAVPGIDLGFLSMPCCERYQLADIMITPGAGLGGSMQWTWSPVTGSPGDTFWCQALCLDPAVDPFGFTISNVIAIELVP